jgi:hypothetical protein
MNVWRTAASMSGAVRVAVWVEKCGSVMYDSYEYATIRRNCSNVNPCASSKSPAALAPEKARNKTSILCDNLRDAKAAKH